MTRPTRLEVARFEVARFEVVSQAMRILLLCMVAWAGSIVVRSVTEALITMTGRDPAAVLDRHGAPRGMEPLVAGQAASRPRSASR